MTIESRYIFVVSMDVEADKEDLFNEVYDQEHVPYLLQVPGVRAVGRAKSEPFAVNLGGERKQMPVQGPAYTAIYEIDGPEVLVSDAWADAVERGRWSTAVRPHTRNRHHALFKVRT